MCGEKIVSLRNNKNMKIEQLGYVSDLEKEIKTLQYQLDHAKTINLKKNTIKNLKISASFFKRFTPYVLSAVMLAGGLKSIGLGYPFHIDDDFKAYAYSAEEIDNLGNYNKEKQYSIIKKVIMSNIVISGKK